VSSPDDTHPARSPITWLLAIVFLVVIDAAITRTDLLWGPTAFENSGGVRVVFPQTYQAARKIYAPVNGEVDARVVLLGNSRVVLALKEHRLEAALSKLRPDLAVQVSNLGIFGSFMGETEMMARHLDALDPSLVVLTVGAPDLIREPAQIGGQGPMEFLRIGFRDGAAQPATVTERLDRWLRTVWRLYRFREFVREAILDRVLGRLDPGPAPQDFATRTALFQRLYGERAPAVDEAYRRWQREGGLGPYVEYLRSVGPGHLARMQKRAQLREPLTRETPAVVAFDAVLENLAGSERPVVVLLMPENPLLALDENGDFHRTEIPDQGAALVREMASEHGLPVVDARDWLPAECFLDFDHPVFELEELERPLAKEIVDVIDPEPR
jgi:hypothetical protein